MAEYFECLKRSLLFFPLRIKENEYKNNNTEQNIQYKYVKYQLDHT